MTDQPAGLLPDSVLEMTHPAVVDILLVFLNKLGGHLWVILDDSQEQKVVFTEDVLSITVNSLG